MSDVTKIHIITRYYGQRMGVMDVLILFSWVITTSTKSFVDHKTK